MIDWLTDHFDHVDYGEDDEDWIEDEEHDEDEWGCEFGDRCLMPGYDHRRSECYTKEMAEAWADEQQNQPA